MNVRIDRYGTIHVTLSRRNLQTLLLKLDVDRSERTIVRRCEDGDELHYLSVKAEEDDEHYGEREPGRMHPREESQL